MRDSAGRCGQRLALKANNEAGFGAIRGDEGD